MTRMVDVKELPDLVGKEVGISDWVRVDQERIDRFADLCGDHQWIHVDVERAKGTPFGGTIAHGYYTLALAPLLTSQIVAYEGFQFALNYGVDRVRFPAPLPVGKKVRAGMKLFEVADIAGGAQVKAEVTFETDAGGKPVCVAETIARFYG